MAAPEFGPNHNRCPIRDFPAAMALGLRAAL